MEDGERYGGERGGERESGRKRERRERGGGGSLQETPVRKFFFGSLRAATTRDARKHNTRKHSMSLLTIIVITTPNLIWSLGAGKHCFIVLVY